MEHIGVLYTGGQMDSLPPWIDRCNFRLLGQGAVVSDFAQEASHSSHRCCLSLDERYESSQAFWILFKMR